jgi:hypothetical protein
MTAHRSAVSNPHFCHSWTTPGSSPLLDMTSSVHILCASYSSWLYTAVRHFVVSEKNCIWRHPFIFCAQILVADFIPPFAILWSPRTTLPLLSIIWVQSFTGYVLWNCIWRHPLSFWCPNSSNWVYMAFNRYLIPKGHFCESQTLFGFNSLLHMTFTIISLHSFLGHSLKQILLVLRGVLLEKLIVSS